MTQPVYKLKDDHVATCGHVRGLYDKIGTEFVKNTGGTVTGDIFLTSNTDPLNAYATKQYVLDNSGGGGGGGGTSHPDKIESQDPGKTTQVICTTDGVEFKDDSLAILNLSKHPTLPTTVM